MFTISSLIYHLLSNFKHFILETSLNYIEQVITLTDESTGLLLDGPDDNKIKLQIKMLDLKQRWKKENVDGTYFYLITSEEETKVLTRESENTLKIEENTNKDSKLFKVLVKN